MDYGKYRYEMQKKEKEQRKNQKIVTVKRSSSFSLLSKTMIITRQAIKFLEHGDRSKPAFVSAELRIHHPQGTGSRHVLEDFIDDTSHVNS